MQAVGIQTALKTIIFWFGIPRFGTVKNSWKKNGMLLREMLCVCVYWPIPVTVSKVTSQLYASYSGQFISQLRAAIHFSRMIIHC